MCIEYFSILKAIHYSISAIVLSAITAILYVPWVSKKVKEKYVQIIRIGTLMTSLVMLGISFYFFKRVYSC